MFSRYIKAIDSTVFLKRVLRNQKKICVCFSVSSPSIPVSLLCTPLSFVFVHIGILILFVRERMGNRIGGNLPNKAMENRHEKQKSSQRKCREHLSNLPSRRGNATHQGISIRKCPRFLLH